MCEWPICYWRQIDEEFMSLPKECVAECMKKHQKFFPFIGGEGHIDKMLRVYCLVADSEPQDTEAMLRGYDSVLRARLRDVQFYYAEDKKIPLADYVERLKTITFHHKLGSQHARIARICKIAAAIAPMVGVKAKPAEIKQTAEKNSCAALDSDVRRISAIAGISFQRIFRQRRKFYFCLPLL